MARKKIETETNREADMDRRTDTGRQRQLKRQTDIVPKRQSNLVGLT